MSRLEAVPLVRLALGAKGRVRELPHGPLRVRLASLGLVAGATIVVLAQQPAAIIRVGSTTLALEPEVGAEILLEPA